MRIVDTDQMTLLERGGIGEVALEIKLAQVPVSEVATTIISYEEQMRGWLSYVSQAKTPERLVKAYTSLQNHVEAYRNTTIFAYDSYASAHFVRLRGARIRIGTPDLKIAAICLSYEATLLTRNLKDFGQVPDLKVEDWSQ